jgi:hypothetical protein
MKKGKDLMLPLLCSQVVSVFFLFLVNVDVQVSLLAALD